jgi:hypothetical protein
MKRIYIVLAFVILIVSLLVYVSKKFPDYSVNVEMIEIYSEKYNQKLYIKKKTWGLTGDRLAIVISSSSDKNFIPFPDKEYIYESSSPFYYSFQNDTLNVYVSKESKVPSGLKTNIYIKQVITGTLILRELSKNYREKGLKTFDND